MNARGGGVVGHRRGSENNSRQAVCSLLPPRECEGSSSRHGAWWRVPLPTQFQDCAVNEHTMENCFVSVDPAENKEACNMSALGKRTLVRQVGHIPLAQSRMWAAMPR